MSVTFQDQAGTRKISVLGELKVPGECLALLSACKTTLLCEINFFDANTLPVQVIEGLKTNIDAGYNINLRVYKSFLMNYLSRLGLPIIHNKSHFSHIQLPPIHAIAIGGSAESLSRILHLIEHLPMGDVAIFIVQHIPENQINYLDNLLRTRTNYVVLMPTNLTIVRSSTIYIAPPGQHMKVVNGTIYLTRDHKVQFARPSLDVLFSAIAIEYGNKAVAVLLCGFGQDGVEGCAEIRRCGGIVLLEVPEDCKIAQALPAAARLANVYDYVLDIKTLTCFIASLIAGRKCNPSADLINLFLEAVYVRYGYDFRDYQRGTIERRIERLSNILDTKDFYQLQCAVLTNAMTFELLLMELSITVTSFFRHPEQFRLLREEILPYLNSFPLIKIWSAGCATGEEVYSLAFLLYELGMLDKTYLFATDMNQPVLHLAEAGLFPYSCLQESYKNYLDSGGKRSFENFITVNNTSFFKIAERFHQRILFHHHSLVHDGVFNEFQLILCRNVFIYFTPQLQQRVLEQFAKSLHREGFLMLGPSENLSVGQGEQLFYPQREALHCYRLKG